MRPVLWAGLVLAGALAIKGANAQIAVQNQGYVPYSEAPIHYRTRPLSDPVALLQKDLDRGAAHLTYDDTRGYLRSVLKALHVPEASQTLVFSKTSFQFTKINPEHPRALYYNDDVYVGSVHQGKTIEIVSFDPMQGAIFYLLDDQKAERPVFQRAELDCTQCHIAAATRGVPGVLLRSVYPAASGVLTPRAPQYITDQKSPLKERWGGWYVSGALADPTMANAGVANAAVTASGALPALGPLATRYDPAAYLTPDSDGVALLVLGHQAQMHNLITLLNYQTRLTLHAQGLSEDARPTLASLPEEAREKITRPAEQLLRYMLFSHETPLGGADAARVIAASPFARQFAAQGPRDRARRSLRDFDLHDRIFRYPCSYLIYSTAFDALPEPGKTYLYHRLFQVLSGADQGEDFAHLTPADRQAILAILRATKRGLPDEWRRKISPNPVSPT
ncbi:hypothetical protein [Novosphingobium sediminicola]|uniref:Cytochrome c domain-containing protein n=1 Tax=Novosphingobium sediminicola TaxID=563162 RepID=A0A7W6CCA7_9SPHN|nr:hypothetical protein [Novosphingobium sediminicola]MBB3953911.1 hypothetical protein [Novosphingobium sediminicola]